MACRIAIGSSSITGYGEELSVRDDTGSNRHFTALLSFTRRV
jgi:hypothetical protein